MHSAPGGVTLLGALREEPSLDLPGVQGELLAAVSATGTPVVLLLTGGGCLAGYPGQEGGPALADRGTPLFRFGHGLSYPG